MYDLIIIGAGPAGLSAGIYAKERNIHTLIIESEELGGQLKHLYPEKTIGDYPGYPVIKARHLAEKIIEQTKRFELNITTNQTVYEIHKSDNVFTVKTKEESYTSKTILIAVGMGFYKPRTLGIEGENSANVHHSFPDSNLLQKMDILCIGGGETAVDSVRTAYESGAKTVSLVHRNNSFRAVEASLGDIQKRGANILTPYTALKIEDKDRKKVVTLEHVETKEQILVPADVICIHIGFIPDATLVEKWGLEIAKRALVVGKSMETNVSGIFACGDITIQAGEYKRITIAQGQAALAVHGVYKYLRSPYWSENISL